MTYKVDVISLQKQMIDNGIRTQTELAQRSNVSAKTINGIMTGKITPSVSIMYKLADCLNMSPEYAGKTFFAKTLTQ